VYGEFNKLFSLVNIFKQWFGFIVPVLCAGMLASINDVTDGSQEIPDYASACGIASLSFEPIARRDILTPYGTYGLFLHNPAVGECGFLVFMVGVQSSSTVAPPRT